MLNRFGTGRLVGTGLCTGEFPERKLRMFIFRLQLHVQPVYIMANPSEKTELYNIIFFAENDAKNVWVI